MTELVVRPAQPGDVDAILDVAARGWRTTYGDILQDGTIETVLDEWYDPESTAEAIDSDAVGYFVAEEGEMIVGYASGAPHDDDDRATLAAIYVHPERWGEGVGTALLDRFEAFCRERGCDAIDLEAIADNDVGTSFYRARGFETVGTDRIELFGEETTETLFRRPIE